MRAEVTADNTSVNVSWEWSHDGVPMCVDLVRVDYQHEEGSLMMYTVDNASATSATLSNLQCNTEYTIWVYAGGGLNDTRSVPRTVSLPARGTCTSYVTYLYICSPQSRDCVAYSQNPKIAHYSIL